MPATPKPLIDVRPDHWAIVRDILQKHVPQYEVWAFGSRAKWSAKEYSDLDLAVVTDHPLSISTSAALADDFAESDLPWKVDVVDWASTAESFRKIIRRDKVVVQKGGVAGEWKETSFGNEVSFVSEKARVSDATLATYVSTENMIAEFGGISAAETLPSSGSVSRFIVGDTLFSNIRTYFKKVWQAKFDGYCSNDVLVIRSADENKFVNDYLYHLCRWNKFTELSVRTSKGAKMPRGDKDALAQFQFFLPLPEEQRAIAHILGSLDDKIELNRRMNETLEAIARAMFKSWFVDFDPVRAKMNGEPPESICQRLGLTPDLLALFPDRLVDSELGEIPEGWRVGTFSDCSERIESGGTPSRSVADFWNGTIPWLTSGEVRDVIVLDTKEKITDVGLNASSAKIWPKGTTVVAMYGATAGQVCYLAEPMTANQACCALIPKPEFVSFVFLTARASISQLSDKASGSAQQNLNKSLVANHQLILPALKIADAFERIVSCLFKKWISNQRECASLAVVRDALLPKLLSGELRVPQADTAMEAIA